MNITPWFFAPQNVMSKHTIFREKKHVGDCSKKMKVFWVGLLLGLCSLALSQEVDSESPRDTIHRQLSATVLLQLQTTLLRIRPRLIALFLNSAKTDSHLAHERSRYLVLRGEILELYQTLLQGASAWIRSYGDQTGLFHLIESMSEDDLMIYPIERLFESQSHHYEDTAIKKMRQLKAELYELLLGVGNKLDPHQVHWLSELWRRLPYLSGDQLKKYEEETNHRLSNLATHLASIRNRIADSGIENRSLLLEEFRKISAELYLVMMERLLQSTKTERVEKDLFAAYQEQLAGERALEKSQRVEHFVLGVPFTLLFAITFGGLAIAEPPFSLNARISFGAVGAAGLLGALGILYSCFRRLPTICTDVEGLTGRFNRYLSSALNERVDLVRLIYPDEVSSPLPANFLTFMKRLADFLHPPAIPCEQAIAHAFLTSPIQNDTRIMAKQASFEVTTSGLLTSECADTTGLCAPAR